MFRSVYAKMEHERDDELYGLQMYIIECSCLEL
jgi:hypothetical protein